MYIRPKTTQFGSALQGKLQAESVNKLLTCPNLKQNK
jgi:hypothetical protein